MNQPLKSEGVLDVRDDGGVIGFHLLCEEVQGIVSSRIGVYACCVDIPQRNHGR